MMYKYYNLYLNNSIFSGEGNLLKINVNASSEEVIDVKVIGELIEGKMYDIVTGKEIILSRNKFNNYDMEKNLIPNITYYKKKGLCEEDVVNELKKLVSISRLEKYYTIIEEIEDISTGRYNEVFGNNCTDKINKVYRRR